MLQRIDEDGGDIFLQNVCFHPEDGGGKFLWNVGSYKNHMATSQKTTFFKLHNNRRAFRDCIFCVVHSVAM
jgi:hypothetical protein